MELILGGLFLAGLIIAANLLVLKNNERASAVFRWLLFALNLPLLLAGLGLLATPVDFFDALLRDSGQLVFTAESLKAMAPAVLFMAVWGMVMSLMAVQRLLARLIPIEPGSPVHTLALVFSGYLMGNSALTLSQGGIEGLVETAEPTSLAFFVFSELLFAAIGFLGVGWLLRRRGRELLTRLGLERPTLKQLIGGVGWIFVLVVLQIIAGLLWTAYNPEQAEALDSISTALLGDFDTVGEWLILALAAGIGEEILFRGAIQQVFGLWFTSFVFAVVHVQYGFSPITVFIILLAAILGIIRRRSNTTVAIFVHVGYDFVLGLLALLAAYAEQFVP
jgi:membrane protease YdiL (CAAX protease family)